LESVKSAPPQN